MEALGVRLAVKVPEFVTVLEATRVLVGDGVLDLEPTKLGVGAFERVGEILGDTVAVVKGVGEKLWLCAVVAVRERVALGEREEEGEPVAERVPPVTEVKAEVVGDKEDVGEAV